MSDQNSINEFKKEDALVLFSGGQDSTTCLYWAKERFKNVYALSFSYGQRHALEVDIARKIARKAGVEFRVLDAGIFTQLASNSLIDTTIQMDEEKPENTFPNTFVPGRNMLFLTFAATIAYDKGIRHLVTGVSQADYSGYPDCRDSFIRSLNVSLNLSMDRQFIIHTPLMWRNKKQVWQLADELGVFDLVQHETLTCYNGIVAEGCGHCPACRLRKKGLEEYLAERL
ncbi:MAG: 7-cyano-7-deazaguanine synthase QueC [Paludibacteraceae bacterium]